MTRPTPWSFKSEIGVRQGAPVLRLYVTRKRYVELDYDRVLKLMDYLAKRKEQLEELHLLEARRRSAPYLPKENT